MNHVPRHAGWLLLIPLVAALLLFGTGWLATPTDLVVRYLAPDVLTIESSTGGDAAFPLASSSAAGLMSSTQAARLDELDGGIVRFGAVRQTFADGAAVDNYFCGVGATSSITVTVSNRSCGAIPAAPTPADPASPTPAETQAQQQYATDLPLLEARRREYIPYASDDTLAIIVTSGSATVWQTYAGSPAAAYNGTLWHDHGGALRGPQGPAGSKGDQGDTGDTGATGAQGPAGGLPAGDGWEGRWASYCQALGAVVDGGAATTALQAVGASSAVVVNGYGDQRLILAAPSLSCEVGQTKRAVLALTPGAPWPPDELKGTGAGQVFGSDNLGEAQTLSVDGTEMDVRFDSESTTPGYGLRIVWYGD